MQKIALILLLDLLTNSPYVNAQDSSNPSPNSITADTSCKNILTSWNTFKECAIQWGGNTAVTLGISASSLTVLALLKCCCKIPAQRRLNTTILNLQPNRLIQDIKNIVKQSIENIERVENDRPDILVDLDRFEYPGGSYIGKFALTSGANIDTLLHKLREANQLLAHLKASRGIILICGNFTNRITQRRNAHTIQSSTSRETVKAVSDICIQNRIPLFIVHVNETTLPTHHFTIKTQTIADINSSQPQQSLKVRGLDALDPSKILHHIKPEISLRAVLFTETNKELYVRPGVAQCFMRNFLQNLQKRSPAAATRRNIESSELSAV